MKKIEQYKLAEKPGPQTPRVKVKLQRIAMRWSRAEDGPELGRRCQAGVQKVCLAEMAAVGQARP